jgi:predicted O-linked N-acetylglucosamine transferase (SPINDLY family)
VATTQQLIQSAYDYANRGRIDQGIADLQRHLRLKGDDAELHHHLGLLLLQTGQLDPALFHLEKCVQLDPKKPDQLNNYATALNYKGKAAQAAEQYRKAVELDPKSFPAQLGLSSALIGTLDFGPAIEEAKKAAGMEPSRAEPIVNHALALSRLARVPEAIEALRDGLTRAPDHYLLLSNLAILETCSPGIAPEETLATLVKIGQIFTRFAGMPQPLFPDFKPERRLRVGYVSQDFRDTATAHFLRGILESHNRDAFEICCYSTTGMPDAVTAELSKLPDRWVDAARFDDFGLDRQVRADRIDILVDLTGYNPGTRLGVMPRHPAPVQVSYPTWFNTTGLKSVTARIVDGFTDPEGAEARATESLVRLEGSCLCYTPSPDTPPVAARSAGPVTFGCFAGIIKLSAPLLDAWAGILKAVPGSRLLLKTQALGSAAARESLLAQLQSRGVAADRVDLAGHTVSAREHLAAYGRVDIALDTFPAASPATACQALDMGVPVVALAGDTHAGRTTAGLLRAAGLGRFIADGAGRYTQIAADLARDGSGLASMRRTLRDQLRGSAACDARAYTARLEAAYRDLWRKACAKVYYTE